MSKLINHMNDLYKNSEVVNKLLDTCDKENEIAENKINDLKNQLNAMTCDWSIFMWEKMLGIIPSVYDLETRREYVLAKIRSKSITNKDALKNVCKAFYNGRVEIIDDPSTYSFTVKFVDDTGIPSNLDGLRYAINNIKPAHLGFDFQFLYNIWNQYKSTAWEEMKLKTWQEIKDGSAIEEGKAIVGTFKVGEMKVGKI